MALTWSCYPGLTMMSRLFVMAISLCVHSSAVAQGTQTSTPQATPQPHDAAELAKKLSNPISSLISFPLQNNFDFGMGRRSAWRYTLNIQLVVPGAESALEPGKTETYKPADLANRSISWTAPLDGCSGVRPIF